MKKRIVMGAVALGMVVFTSGAYAITIDGNWNDWFTSNLATPSAAWWWNGGTGNAPAIESSAIAGHDQMLPTSVITGAGYALDYEHHSSSGLNTSWGEVYGGAEDNQDGVGNVINTQAYDIEAVMALVQLDLLGNATLNLGIVTGMDSNGENVAGGMIYPGDVFFNFDGGAYDRAVRIGTDPGSTYGGGIGALFTAPMGTTTPVDFTTSRPYRVGSGGTPIGSATVAWDNTTTQHHFVEMSFGLSSAELTSLRTNGIDVHWTVSCGNDVFNPHFQILPRPPVPEPSTLALMGLGVLGLALRRKFKA